MDNFPIVKEEDFDRIWKETRIKRIINYLRSKFPWLPRYRLIQAARIALWQAIRRHKSDPLNKKAASFYTFFRAQCYGYFLKEGYDKHEGNSRGNTKSLLTKNDIDETYSENNEVVDCLLSLTEKDRILFEDRFVRKMTHEEMSQKHGVTKAKISKQLKNIVEFLKTGENYE